MDLAIYSVSAFFSWLATFMVILFLNGKDDLLAAGTNGSAGKGGLESGATIRKRKV